jgi:AraC family ethanolamine operon transcriptional activator
VIEEHKLETTTSTHDATTHVAHLDCDSFDEFAEATSGWALDWRQLDRGPLRASLTQVATPSVLVTQFLFSRKFHQRGTSPPGIRTFGIVGAQSSPVEWNGHEGSKDRIEVFPTSDTYECVSHPGFHANGVSISEDCIRSVAEVLGLPDPLERLPEGPCFVESNPLQMKTLRHSLSWLYSAVAAHADIPLSEAACSEMEFEIHSALVGALATGLETELRSPNPTFRSRALRLALEYIEEQADCAPTIKDICRASGASYRTLNRAFLDRFGVVPKQYLQAIRLDGVRKDLRRMRPYSAITDVANEWGFWHMGQFARDYRRQFGELPSKTRNRLM